jgi:hypothetical protein
MDLLNNLCSLTRSLARVLSVCLEHSQNGTCHVGDSSVQREETLNADCSLLLFCKPPLGEEQYPFLQSGC